VAGYSSVRNLCGSGSLINEFCIRDGSRF
jgi:hypothetical protein